MFFDTSTIWLSTSTSTRSEQGSKVPTPLTIKDVTKAVLVFAAIVWVMVGLVTTIVLLT